MESSRKLKSSDPLARRLADRLVALGLKGRSVCVGLSGGQDSVVLFAIMREISTDLEIPLSCIHVNHGISENADSWEAFCRRLCQEHDIPLTSVRVDISGYPGHGTEAAARSARYAAFSRLSAEFVLLAHHQDDQAETVLVQLLRGSGVKGLAGMPEVRRATGPAIVRPLLFEPAHLVSRYAHERKLAWVDDESNYDQRFVRNFLRHVTLASLERRFPGAHRAIARSAEYLSEAQALLDDLAQIDLRTAMFRQGIRIEFLEVIGASRARNLLRYWLAGIGVRIPEATHLEEILRQLRTARPDADICFPLGTFVCRRFRGVLYVEPSTLPLEDDFRRQWHGEAPWVFPELGGQIDFSETIGNGLSTRKIAASELTVRLRNGKAWFKPDAARPRRSLKNIFQEHGIPPWERDRIPLLYCGGELVYVPYVGVASAFRAGPGEAGVSVSWRRA